MDPTMKTPMTAGDGQGREHDAHCRKPTPPISKRANIGLFYIKNWKLLFEGIDHVLKLPTNKGEFISPTRSST